MLREGFFQPKYQNSWALVIGINEYQHVPHLHYATNDAEALGSIIVEKLGFPKDNVTNLLDGDATKDKILTSVMGFTKEHVHPDDRLLVFFAGHGHTVRGNRGDVGFLVPVDARRDDPATLIPWHALTKSTELIKAKHVLFIMDACYGGLALMRCVPPGTMRFLKDMLQRYSRQVITAGKADQVVSD